MTSDTSGSNALANRSPSAAALDLPSLHYHKRTLFDFLRGSSKSEKMRMRKGKDAEGSSMRCILAPTDVDKAVDSNEGEASLSEDVNAEWTQGPDECAKHFLVRLNNQVKNLRAEGKLDETVADRLKNLNEALFYHEMQGVPDEQDLRGQILKVIDGMKRKEEDSRRGKLKLFKRSANAKSSKLSQLMRPLLNDPDVWAKDKENFQQYWKHGKNEDMEQFRNRLKNQAEACLRHKVLDEVTTRTI